MIEAFVISLGMVPYFATRAFVPLFAAACVTRWGPEWGPLVEHTAIEHFGQVPTALTSNLVMTILFVFALLEVAIQKSPELRELAQLYDNKLKATAAFATTLALLWDGIAPDAVALHAQASVGGSLVYLWAGLIGAVVWFTALSRDVLFGFLRDVDPDDDLGVQGLLSWLEDLIGFFGVLFVVILPMVSLALAGLTVLALFLLRKYLEHREEKAKVPCPHCATPCSPCGIRCPGCGHLRHGVQQVGTLGTIRQTFVTDLESHRLSLLQKKRCSSCGDRLKERRLEQACTTCQTQAFSTPAEVENYLIAVRSRLPKISVVLFCLSAIPLVGLVAGIVYYRLSIIASLRCYVPRGTGFFARWVVRAINLVLLCFQPVPILGAFVLPLMCLANYSFYRGLLRRQASSGFVSDKSFAPGTA